MVGRVPARQNVRVRGERGDVVRVCVGEPDAGRSEAIDRRRAGAAVSVRSDGVGAERIDGNKENVKTGVAPDGRLRVKRAAAAGKDREADDDGDRVCGRSLHAEGALFQGVHQKRLTVGRR